MICHFSVAGLSQTLSYAYDACGNRIGRAVTVQMTSAPQKVAGQIDEYMDERGSLKMRVWPNPTQGDVHVELVGDLPAEGMTVQVYSVSGQMIEQREVASNLDIDLGGRPDGLYIIRILHGSREETWKIIKN